MHMYTIHTEKGWRVVATSMSLNAVAASAVQFAWFTAMTSSLWSYSRTKWWLRSSCEPCFLQTRNRLRLQMSVFFRRMTAHCIDIGPFYAIFIVQSQELGITRGQHAVPGHWMVNTSYPPVSSNVACWKPWTIEIGDFPI